MNISKIVSNKKIAKDIYMMQIDTIIDKKLLPGQFVNIKIDNLYLRRPISVCDYKNNILTIVYKIVGKGTKALSTYKATDDLDILYNLGNGYSIKENKNILLVGGGVGIPPLYYLAKKLKNCKLKVILGYSNKQSIFLETEFKEILDDVVICTDDGSVGYHGFVTDYIKEKKLNPDYYYSCGPEAMLLSLKNTLSCSGELSFEERMGCGFGACMGCSKLTKHGSIRVCKEGPVLKSEVIIC